MRIAAGIVLLVGAAGCGDPIACESDVFVAIQTMSVAIDVDPAPGVQTDLHVKSSLAEGESIAIAIQDAAGHATGDASATVDATGDAVVRVTLPTPTAMVSATASGLCGTAEDAVAISVSAGADCELALSPAPHAATYYAPLGVLLAADDADSATSGLQSKITVATRTDWVVDLWVGGPQGEHASGTNLPTMGGVVPAVFATLPEGQATVRAVCHDGTGSEQVASATTTVVVDSSAPACEIASPAMGTKLNRALDFDHDSTNGLQVAIGVDAGASRDVEGETFSITATPVGGGGGAPVTAAGTFGPSSGAAVVTVLTGTARIDLIGRDHAGNPCAATRTYAVDAAH